MSSSTVDLIIILTKNFRLKSEFYVFYFFKYIFLIYVVVSILEMKWNSFDFFQSTSVCYLFLPFSEAQCYMRWQLKLSWLFISLSLLLFLSLSPIPISLFFVFVLFFSFLQGKSLLPPLSFRPLQFVNSFSHLVRSSFFLPPIQWYNHSFLVILYQIIVKLSLIIYSLGMSWKQKKVWWTTTQQWKSNGKEEKWKKIQKEKERKERAGCKEIKISTVTKSQIKEILV